MATKVLHVYKTYSLHTTGGIEEVLKQLCSETSQLDIINHIVCLSEDCTEKTVVELPEATIHCYPLSFEVASCGFSWALWQDFKMLTEWADVIHYQFPWPFADLLAYFKQPKTTPYIVSYQSDIVRQKSLNRLYQPLMKRFLSAARKIVATSPKYIQSSDVLAQYVDKTVMIPNGIADNIEAATFEHEKQLYKQKYGESFFLFVGVFRYYKGLDYLLQAAKQTKMPILLVGDGPENNHLRDYVEQHQLTHVHFLGKVTESQKHALIDLATALVLPSSERSEAYGMVLLEAARQSTAMISTELASGTSYINEHEKSGLVVPAKSAQGLATAMNYMAENKEIVEKMGQHARQRFISLFQANLMGQSYQDLYQTVLQK